MADITLKTDASGIVRGVQVNGQLLPDTTRAEVIMRPNELSILQVEIVCASVHSVPMDTA